MLSEFYRYFRKVIEVIKDFELGFALEIAINLIIFYGICKALDLFEKSINNKLINSDKNNQIVKVVYIINRILKFIVFLIMFTSFLQTHGYSVSSLIAGLGITGLAVGLAANTTLANIFGTISVIADKSFKIGDYIKIGNYEGTVEDINMRSTKIRTLDNFLTIIPNSQIANTEIINVSACHRRRLYETIGVSYDTSNEKLECAIKILEEIMEETPAISKDFLIYLETLADSSINIKVHAYIKTKQHPTFVKERQKFWLAVIKRFRAENIEFAFPSRTIYMAKENDEN